MNELGAAMESNLDRLRAQLPVIEPYPAGVVPVREPIAGLAFFPGGSGLWQYETGARQSDIPVGGVMVLGHDFHSEEQYEHSKDRGCEDLNAPTWRNLLELLDETGASRKSCFYTNFFMGLRAGKQTTGVFPGKKDKAFVQRCRDFFLYQVEVQKPRIILVLGAHVPRLLAPLADKLHLWSKAQGLGAIDTAGAALVCDVSFGRNHHFAHMVALTHPSLRHANLRHRRSPGTMSGQEYELELIRKALA